MTAQVSDFMKTHLPTVQKIIEREGLVITGFGKAVFQEDGEQGYPIDKKKLDFEKNLNPKNLDAPVTEEEIKQANEEIARAPWPEEVAVVSFEEKDLPMPFRTHWQSAKPEYKFTYKNKQGEILMLEVRVDKKVGKDYPTVIPVVWENSKSGAHEWVSTRPETSHLYGLETLKGNTTVIIVEGAKTANAVREIQEGKTEWAKKHPFKEDLQHAAVVAWPNGANSARKADWSALKGFTSATIWPDNDDVGKAAVPVISKALDFHVSAIKPDPNVFPTSWDLADEVPMEERKDGEKEYIGPSFLDMLEPATWMTNMVPVADSKKQVPVLRKHALRDWAYISSLELFINKNTGREYKPANLNRALKPFSDVDVSNLLLSENNIHHSSLGYRPDKKPLTGYNDKGADKFNFFRPTTIQAFKAQNQSPLSDVAPFIEFIKYLFPDEDEQKQMLKWSATLIARPETRMLYGTLLISNRQGVGKSMLGHEILAPLIGAQNVSYPTASTVGGDFNEWQRAKRLAIIDEIYTDSSWKFYNKIKGAITEKTVEINSKNDKQYALDNFIVPFASSNSSAAFAMETGDRRWFVPRVTEEIWEKKKFTELFAWLKKEQGLAKILAWAKESHVGYVEAGEHAPMSERKKEMAEDAKSEEQQQVEEIFQEMFESKAPMVWTDKCAKSKFGVDAKPLVVKQWALNSGLFVQGRIKIDGVNQNPIMNLAAKSVCGDSAGEMRKHLINLDTPPVGGENVTDFAKYHNMM